MRNIDPAEQYLIEKHRLAQITVDDMRDQTLKITGEIDRLAALTDFIYVHIDLDVITSEEMPGHGTSAPDGPTADELANTIEVMFKHPKVTGLGLASYPGANDVDDIGLKSTLKQVEGAVKGIKARK